MEAILVAGPLPSATIRNPRSCRIEWRGRGALLRGRNELVRVADGRQKAQYQILVTTRYVRAVVKIDNSGRVIEDGERFPYLTKAGRKVMTNVSTVLEQELGHLLQESQTPADVKYFKSEDGNAEGSVVLRAGKDSSKVDFILESWLHATLPFGTLDIATLVVMLGPETDSPHFLFEFILSGPSLVVVLDHLPRKDLVLESEYQKRFYENPGLDKIRQRFEEAPNAKPYISPVLFVRSVVSPTAVLYKLSGSNQVDDGGLEEQIENVVYPGSEKLIQAWVESFLTHGSPVTNIDDMVKRDSKIKTMGIEVDLSGNLPRLFGQTIADRIVEAFKSGGRIKVRGWIETGKDRQMRRQIVSSSKTTDQDMVEITTKLLERLD